MLSVIMQNFVLPSDDMLNVVTLSAVMMSVVVPNDVIYSVVIEIFI
jgi:hypothetical protein